MSKNTTIPDLVYENLDTDILKFILSQAEKKIGNMTDEVNMYYNRSITILTVSLPIITLLIGYLFKATEPLPNKIAATVIEIFLLFVCKILRQNILPSVFETNGSSANRMLDIAFYENTENKDAAHKNVLIDQVKLAQLKILNNERLNKDRGDNIKKAIRLLYWCPIVVLAVFLITYLFSHNLCLG